MTVPGADPSGTGPFRAFVPAVSAGVGASFGNPPAGVGGTVLTATFG
ncbi:hypothetical protein GCM10022252_26990 [Streptosporangium oxazolinicum]|uniref:Uncharacterized protein n=1 Tax=Streptosporangium oxazolinicum TaxID=909287 RepID=A0ABP8ASV1_9ACTN